MSERSGRRFGRRTALAASLCLLTACTIGRGARKPAPRVNRVGVWSSAQEFDRVWGEWQESVFDGDAGNDDGRLQWRSHYALLALCRMYEATHDSGYLRVSGRLVGHLLSQTDEARGVTDCDGASGPVWRQGASSSVSRVALPDPRGVATLELRCSLPDSNLATVDLRATGTRFSLTLRHPSQPEPVRLAGLSTMPGDDRFVERVMLTELTGRATGWVASVRSERTPADRHADFVEQFITMPGTTGLLTYPIAVWARLVRQAGLDPVPGSPRVGEVVDLLTRAVAVHEPEWTVSGNSADWVIPKGYPTRFDGLGQPWNQSHALGATVAELFRLTGDESCRDKVARLVAGWRSDWEPDRDWVQWRHWPRNSPVYKGYTAADQVSTNSPQRGPFTDWEDLSHGALSMEFAAAAADAGVGLNKADLSLLSRAFGSGLLLDGGVRDHFDGTPVPSDQQLVAAQWLAVAERGPARQVNNLLASEPAVPATAAGLLASGYLNLARARQLL